MSLKDKLQNMDSNTRSAFLLLEKQIKENHHKTIQMIQSKKEPKTDLKEIWIKLDGLQQQIDAVKTYSKQLKKTKKDFDRKFQEALQHSNKSLTTAIEIETNVKELIRLYKTDLIKQTRRLKQ